MKRKSWYKSKTLIFNILLIVGGLYAPLLAEGTRNILLTTGIANVLLRLRTSEGLRK